eukprot:scaffold100849_cov43-Prasinocladus_malaysianus.AAC.1
MSEKVSAVVCPQHIFSSLGYIEGASHHTHHLERQSAPPPVSFYSILRGQSISNMRRELIGDHSIVDNVWPPVSVYSRDADLRARTEDDVKLDDLVQELKNRLGESGSKVVIG